MKAFVPPIPKAAFFALTLLSLSVAENSKPPVARTSAAPATHSDFHGWKAIILRNRAAEVVIVPEIGRVMEFNLVDAAGRTLPGPFWENPGLDQNMPADSEGWRNYGGDKAWPAPQSDWPKMAGREWPPPGGFDAISFAATFAASSKGHRLELVSPVDAAYGVRIRRTISLDERKPAVTIKTVYEKVSGAPVRVSVWTITQLASPDRAFILLPRHSQLPRGYTLLTPTAPHDLEVDGRLLSLSRDLTSKTKIGSDGEALLWVGSHASLLLESKAADVDSNKMDSKQAEWPEQGSHSQIYTSPSNAMNYVEFELLGRLHTLKPGEKTSLEVVYTLVPRAEPDAVAEARKVFHLP